MANMHLVTGYGGESHITASDVGSLNAAVFGNEEYVLNRGNKFAATILSNNSIKIADGDLMMQGRHARINEGGFANVTIENGQQGYKRNDLIVARYTVDASTGIEEVNLAVIKGTASNGTPTIPNHITGSILDDHDVIVDMPLYMVVLDGLSIEEIVTLFNVHSSRNIIVDKVEPETIASTMNIGDIYLHCPDMP